MAVSIVLNNKFPRMIAVSPLDSLQDSAKRMSEQKIGSVAVIDTCGSVIGLLCEKDIVRAVAASPVGVQASTAGDWMTGLILDCSPEDSTDTVLRRISDSKSRFVTVIESGKAIGILSIGDLVNYRLQQIDALIAEVTQKADERARLSRFTSHLKTLGG